MDRLPLYFSVVFYVCFVIYIFIGIYVFSQNSKSTVNRLFSLICLSLSIWSFSFSSVAMAQDAYICSFWSRLASLGWGSVYSLLFHFSLVLFDSAKRYRKKLMMLFIYLPVLINVTVLGLFAPFFSVEYSFVKIATGWINLARNPFWDSYFYIYYICFSFLSVGTFFLLISISHEIVKRRQAIVIVITFIFVFFLASFTDVFSRIIWDLELPQMAPIIVILPVVVIFYSINKYGLILSSEAEKNQRQGYILSEGKRKIFYLWLSVAFYISSILNMTNILLYATNHDAVIHFSLLLVGLGVIIHSLPNIRLNADRQDLIMSIVVALSVPLLLLRFYTAYTGSIIWPLPILFISAAAIFSKRRLLIIVSISTVLTLIYMLIFAKTEFIYIGIIDYTFRITITLSAIIIAYNINRIYISRLKENEYQIKLQELISEVSTGLVAVSLTNYEEKIETVLKISCEFLDIDRSFFYLFSKNQEIAIFQKGWYKESVPPRNDFVKELDTTKYHWWMTKLRENGILYFEDITEVPSDAVYEHMMMEKHQMKSMVSCGINGKEQLLGFIGFYTIEQKKVWHQNELKLIKVIANLTSDAMTKVFAENEIHHLAFHDSLTGLANRRFFKQMLNEHILQKPEMPICIIFLDLDAFKNVNDTIGHEGGDDLLIEVSRMLKLLVKERGVVSRFGGDEFLIYIDKFHNNADIIDLADKIMELFSEPIRVLGYEFEVTTSAGIAFYPEDGETAGTLIKNADLAMYASKNKGKNQYTQCSKALKDEIHDRLQLSHDLKNALSNSEFQVYYQPQVDTQTKEIIGLEALLRWFHPILGSISPNVFIPLAEETGLIHEIGTWVLREACMQNAQWQRSGFVPLRIAINLSVEQFKESNLPERIQNILIETDLEPQYLELEITESIAIIDEIYITKTLQELKQLGLKISIDDFGTGYSSLNRLKTLPIDRIKIAMQFVNGLSIDEKDDAIARVIISLAKNLNLKVIAEGVETVIQENFLCEHLCDEIQGYFFYRPMPKDEIEKLLTHKER